MRQRIRRVGVFQTAKVVALFYFVLVAIFLIPFAYLSSFMEDEFDFAGIPVGGVLLVAIPFLYSVIAFIMTVVGCLFYNLIAKITGGFEFEVDVVDKPIVKQEVIAEEEV